MTASERAARREQEDLLRRSAREFAERTATPERLRELEARGEPPAAIWREIVGIEWPGILIDPAYGGVGGTLNDASIIYEEMGRVLLPSPHLSSAVIAAHVLAVGGTEAQRAEHLPLIANGSRVIVPAISEEDDSWGPGGIQLRAERRGDRIVLNGTKQFIPDADMADVFLCAARSGDGRDDIALVLVDAAAAGLTRRTMRGWTGSPLFEVDLREVDVPAANLIPGGWGSLEPALAAARVLLCSYMAGAMERVWEISIDYAHHRVQFGQPIAKFQRVQDHIVDMRQHTDSARVTQQEALVRLERGDPAAEQYVTMAKILASEGFYTSCDAAHHVHAGIGSSREYGLYLYTKASRSLYHYLGSPDMLERRLGDLLAAV